MNRMPVILLKYLYLLFPAFRLFAGSPVAADRNDPRAAGGARRRAVHATVVGWMRKTPARRCCIAQAACTSL